MLRTTGAVSVAGALGVVAGACGRPERAAAEIDRAPVKLPTLFAATERESADMPAPLPRNERVGFAIVGLGRLALDQILPAFAHSKLCKPVALVSGDAAKASKVAAQYGIDGKSIYDYKTFDRLKDNSAVQVVYVVLPNSMHAEYTVRAAQAGQTCIVRKANGEQRG